MLRNTLYKNNGNVLCQLQEKYCEKIVPEELNKIDLCWY